jgi:hypothetical protein
LIIRRNEWTSLPGPRDTLDLLALAGISRETAGTVTLRGLSIRLYNDSKRLETLLRKTDAFTLRLTGRKISDRLDLERAFPETLLSGSCTLVFADGDTWDLREKTIGLTPGTIERIKKIQPDHDAPGNQEPANAGPAESKPAAPSFLVIENKETFSVLAESCAAFAGYVYTGGYPNRAALALLEKCAASDGRLRYFGDLDPEGLLIFEHIHRCFPDMTPFLMDTAVYSHYLTFGYDLSDDALMKLDQVRYRGFTELVREMRIHKKGVEQEIVETAKTGKCSYRTTSITGTSG